MEDLSVLTDDDLIEHWLLDNAAYVREIDKRKCASPPLRVKIACWRTVEPTPPTPVESPATVIKRRKLIEPAPAGKIHIPDPPRTDEAIFGPMRQINRELKEEQELLTSRYEDDDNN